VKRRPSQTGATPDLDKYRVQVLDRAFDLLDLLAESDSPLAASDLCRRSRLSKSTVHRLLTVLESRQIVRRQPATHYFSLGPKLLSLARRFNPEGNRDTAQQLLNRLAHRTGGIARLGVLRMGDQVLLVQTSGSSDPESSGQKLELPVHCTALGKALAAYEPLFSNEFLPYFRFLAYTNRTITEASRFRSELKRVQTCGFACDNEEYQPGFRCLAAPIRNARGHVVAALSISGRSTHINNRNQREILEALLATARELSPSVGLFLHLP
jgi:DNA-binding IclR family transcriptional regulator